MNVLKKLTMITILLVSSLISSTALYSQNETGTRNLNDTMFKETHSWYDSNTAMFQHRLPIIRSIPPLNTSMPLDVLISYIYLDSLLRSPLANTLEKKLESWTTLNDTLTYAAKALLTLKDYNSMIFNQYSLEVGWQRGRDPGIIYTVNGQQRLSTYAPIKYHTSLEDLSELIPENFYRILKSDTNMAMLAKAYYAVLYSDHILRVKVISIDSTINKLSPRGYRYNVTAQVVDTILGKIIPALPNNSQIAPHRQDLMTSNNLSTHYTTFEYVPHNYITNPLIDRDNHVTEGWVEDSCFTVSNWNHSFKLKPGQDAIVFLGYDNHIPDNQNDYYNLDLQPTASYNALPIIEENVRDINHIWSNQNTLTYGQWLTIVQNIISKIKNRNF